MTGEDFGSAVALSGDGMTLVASARSGNIGGAITGYIKIYKYDDNSSDWQEQEQTNGESDGDKFGVSASLNHDGSILAVSAKSRNGKKGVGMCTSIMTPALPMCKLALLVMLRSCVVMLQGMF